MLTVYLYEVLDGLAAFEKSCEVSGRLRSLVMARRLGESVGLIVTAYDNMSCIYGYEVMPYFCGCER